MSLPPTVSPNPEAVIIEGQNVALQVTERSPLLKLIEEPLMPGDDTAAKRAAGYVAHGARSIRQTQKQLNRAGRRSYVKPGSKRTPPVDELYGPLVKAGLARIIRKKGQAPRVEFLIAA